MKPSTLSVRLILIIMLPILLGSVFSVKVKANISDIEHLSTLDEPQDDKYKRKSSPTVHPTVVPEKKQSDTYKNYGVSSTVTKEKATQSSEDNSTYKRQSAPQEYAGYAVRSAGGKDIEQNPVTVDSNSETVGYTQKRVGESTPNDNGKRNDAAYSRQSTGEQYGGYAVRSAGGKDIEQNPVTTTNSGGESFDGYQVRSAGQTSRSNSNTSTQSYGEYQRRRVSEPVGSINDYTTEQKSIHIGNSLGENYGGYAVRSAGASNNTQKVTRSYDNYDEYDDSSRTSNLYRLYEGTKYYDRRGTRTSLSASKLNAIVIIMPKQGKSVAGTVIQDNPGSYIIIETIQGDQASFKYDDIDALVSI